MIKRHILICDDQRRFIDEFIRKHGSYYDITFVNDTRELPQAIRQLKTLPDLLLLDSYYPREHDPDFEQRRREAEESLTGLDQHIEETKQAVNRAWEPFGIKMLKILRDDYTPQELPIAIYTQKGLFLLEDPQLQDVEALNAHWLLKGRLSARTEEVRIDRIISYWKKPTGDRVFIIHGHDGGYKDRLRTLLKERFGLNPMILSDIPGAGRTLIQKFEDEAVDATFAFALLTPDDLVKSDEDAHLQARPNVLFEIGWFYGRLGHSRVCLLHKGSTAIPSDLHGVSLISFREQIEEKFLEIERELKKARLID